MASRMIARGRHLSTAALVWVGALLLGLADACAVAYTHGSPGGVRLASVALAVAAGFLLGTAALRGVGSLIARVRIRQALAAREAATMEQVAVEVRRGIAQIEAFLAGQQSHGA